MGKIPFSDVLELSVSERIQLAKTFGIRSLKRPPRLPDQAAARGARAPAESAPPKSSERRDLDRGEKSDRRFRVIRKIIFKPEAEFDFAEA